MAPGISSEALSPLLPILEDARKLGFLGPGPVHDHLARSIAFVEVAPRLPRTMADLGSGGGIPALVLVQAWPATEAWLIESNERRAGWLREAIRELGADGRCRVIGTRAEEVARSSLRGTCELVSARGFAPPGPTAECGTSLLRPAGDFLVAGPPDDSQDRWPEGPLRELGLVYAETRHCETEGTPATITRLVRLDIPVDRYPRRTGVPFKRPLF